jgi:Uma2 family endonuclease
MTASVARPPVPSSRSYRNAAEWLHALGNVPLDRIIFNPLPGTATEEDLLQFVEREKRLCELIDGTLVEKPMGLAEGMIAMRLGAHLTLYCDAQQLGIVAGADSTLRMRSSGRIRLPDVLFISFDRLPDRVLPPERIPTIAPDLAVEVLSESNTTAEIAQKLREYFQSGTKLVWIVDPPTRTIAVYHSPDGPTRVLTETDLVDGETVVPGFSLHVSDLFRNLPVGS